LATPGQNARLTFAGSEGERVSVVVRITSGTFYCCGRIEIRNATTNALIGTDATFYGGATALLEPVTLPSNDSYVVVVDPAYYNTGSVDVNLYDVTDVTGTLTVNGSSMPLALSPPGTNGRLTFDVSSGQQVTVRGTSNTISSVRMQLKKSDGTILVNNTYSSANFSLPTQTLTPDTYTIVIDPSSYYTGNINVAVTSP
jgi:hypothetical protein